MALTEIQLPTKAEFFRVIQGAASDMDSIMLRWKNMAEFLANVESIDLDAMGIAAGQVRTDLIDFRIAMNNIINLYEGEAVTPIKNPSTVIDKIRRLG